MSSSGAGLLITGSLVRTHSGACFIINFTSLPPTSALPVRAFVTPEKSSYLNNFNRIACITNTNIALNDHTCVHVPLILNIF